MSLDLQILRTAKAALDEGLLNPADYESMKASFIKAQSIKAGVEAGFISESDYAEARNAFFSGLGMSIGGTSAASVRPAQINQVDDHAPRGNGTASTIKKSTSQQPARSSAAPTSAPAKAMPAATEPAATKAAPDKPGLPPLSLPEGPAQPESSSPSTAGGSRAPSLMRTPTGLSDRGGRSATADKKSMAGIKVNPDSVNILWEVNIKKTYRWVAFHIGQAGKEVEIEKVGAPASTWEEFVDDLPENQCRYGVFDYEYTNSEGTTFGKLCFVSWAPDTAPVKAKMQHASTKDLFRSMLDGLAVEMNATEKGDLSEDSLRERVKSTVAKK